MTTYYLFALTPAEVAVFSAGLTLFGVLGGMALGYGLQHLTRDRGTPSPPRRTGVRARRHLTGTACPAPVFAPGLASVFSDPDAATVPIPIPRQVAR